MTHGSQPRSILVVEDATTDQELMVYILSQAGFKVTSAGTGAEALRLVRQEHFHLAFVDLRLPGMDGLTLIPLLMEADPRLLIAVVSGHIGEEELRKVIEIGNGRCLIFEKPYVTKDNMNVMAMLAMIEHAEAGISRGTKPRYKTMIGGTFISIGASLVGMASLGLLKPTQTYWVQLTGYVLTAIGGAMLGLPASRPK